MRTMRNEGNLGRAPGRPKPARASRETRPAFAKRKTVLRTVLRPGLAPSGGRPRYAVDEGSTI